MKLESKYLACMTGVVLLAACSTVTYESYRPVQNRNVDIAYVADGANFGKYRRLLVEEMGIFYPTHAPASEEDIAKVRAAFQQAFRRQLDGYEIVTKSAPDVMKVRGSLVDLRNTAADRLPNLSDDLNAILQAGKLTFLIEMRDAQSGNLLLRAADTQKSPRIDMPDDATAPTDEVVAAAEYWAQMFRNFLDQNLAAAAPR